MNNIIDVMLILIHLITVVICWCDIFVVMIDQTQYGITSVRCSCQIVLPSVAYNWLGHEVDSVAGPLNQCVSAQQ